ncbi:MAG: ketol-acid reductoisomerase [Planctomycetota bacterium]|nr:ketol-acid reductoisomerase [Planctomycetota bacterium]
MITRGTENAPLDPLMGKTISILGYGNQGRAQALNLRDSGLQVIIGNRPDSQGTQRAKADGFEPRSIPEASEMADLAILALPDERQGEIYSSSIAPHLKPGSHLGFLTGFAIRYGQVKPTTELGVIMVAPKGPGATLRQRFESGLGIPCLFAIHQDSPEKSAHAIGLAWASGIGCARAGIIHTTFAAEAETDLFGEQSVLVGGMTALILAAFETLVEAGYPPELAYVECCHEAKQVADLVYEHGLASMMKAISNTAEFGAYHTIEQFDDEAMRTKMKRLLRDVLDDSFTKRMLDDRDAGFPWFESQRNKLKQHPIEAAGESIRSLMRRPDEESHESNRPAE